MLKLFETKAEHLLVLLVFFFSNMLQNTVRGISYTNIFYLFFCNIHLTLLLFYMRGLNQINIKIFSVINSRVFSSEWTSCWSMNNFWNIVFKNSVNIYIFRKILFIWIYTQMWECIFSYFLIFTHLKIHLFIYMEVLHKFVSLSVSLNALNMVLVFFNMTESLSLF